MRQRERQRVVGAVQLSCDAIGGTTALARRNHHLVAGQVFSALAGVAGIGRPARLVQSIHDGIADLAYGAVSSASACARAVSDRVAASMPAGSTEAGQANVERRTPGWDTLEGVLNGLYGDVLAGQGNGLATTMSLRVDGKSVPLTAAAFRHSTPAATPRVCLFIHGLACTESIWQPRPDSAGREQVHFGPALTADLGFTPLYVRYNSGLPVADNGRELALLLADLLSAYPTPIEELVLIGHSMGGLVARAAVHRAVQTQAPWLPLLSTVVHLGTPHCGAPLARAADVASKVLRRIPTPGTQIPAELLELRSRGIRDLSIGCSDDESDGMQRPQAIPGRGAFSGHRRTDHAVASTLTQDPHHPFGRLLGDLLVRPESAAGHCGHDDTPDDWNSWTVGGLHHFQLTTDPVIYEQIRAVLASAR